MSTFKTVLALLVFALTVSCDPSDNNKAKIDYLIPQLHGKPIHALEMSSAEGSTKMIRRDNLWWVDKPVSYLANQAAIEFFLVTLSDAEIGKRINVVPADHGQLGVDKESGITAHIDFGENEKITVIIGDVDFPDDQSDGLMLGYGTTARTYIRIIGKSDDVYLAPISMVSLTAKPSLWTNNEFIRIPSFKRLKMKSEGIVTHEFFREKMFAPLYRLDAKSVAHKVNPNTFDCFESFLKGGKILTLSTIDTQLETNKGHTPISLSVEDFLGVSYDFLIGIQKKPSEEDIERHAMQAGFFNDGVAPIPVPFTVKATTTDLELNHLQQTLRESNLTITERLDGRVPFAKLKGFSCLFELLGDIK